MKKISLLLVAAIALASIFSSCSKKDEDNKKGPVKIEKKNDQALLLVTFGSTWDAPHKTFAAMKDAFKKQFPTYDVYISFTSTTCITRWGSKTGEYFATPDLWLDAIGKEGYKKVLVQSLHVIPGQEYEELVKYVNDFKDKYANIPVGVGDALLTSDKDIEEVGDALYKTFKNQLDKGEAIAFLGHGNPDEKYLKANKKYELLRSYIQKKDPKMYLGTVDYNAMLIDFVIDDLNKTFKKNGVVNLTPLMSIAGDHANNDMAGDEDPKEKPEDQSWKVQIKKAGYMVENKNCILKGLGDYSEIVNVWIRHSQEALKNMK